MKSESKIHIVTLSISLYFTKNKIYDKAIKTFCENFSHTLRSVKKYFV